MWYKTRGKNDILIEFPELFYLQTCDDDFIASVSEVVGYVRVRRKCHADILKKDLRIDDKKFEEICMYLEKLPSIKIIDNATGSELLFETKDVADPVNLAYVKSLKSIKRLRENARESGTIQVTQETLVDKNKTNTEGMIRQLYFDCRAHEKIGCKIRLRIIKTVGKYMEKYAEGVSVDKLLDVFKDKFHSVEIVRSQIWFLKNIVEFIDKKNKKVFLTNDGMRILAQIHEKESRKFLKDAENIIDLLNVPEYIHIPSLLKILEDPRNQFSPFKKDKVRTKIFWVKENSDRTEIGSDRIENFLKIHNNILASMIEKSYPINLENISESLLQLGVKIRRPILNVFLDDMIATSRLNKDGSFYEYAIEARIYDLFEKNKEKKLTVLQIIGRIGIAKIDTAKLRHNSIFVERILGSFEEKDVLLKTKTYKGYPRWQWAGNYFEKQKMMLENMEKEKTDKRTELNHAIHHQVLLLLKQQASMNRNELEEIINDIIIELDFEIFGDERKNKISDTISKMIAQDYIYSDGFTLKYSEDSR
ncbi:MAG: hypothetical protein HOL90_02830 [Candidatus Nitrosopelagicus sp.]|nr:hypothetical protein [Candidatus Nitrosopelagicus sp.]